MNTFVKWSFGLAIVAILGVSIFNCAYITDLVNDHIFAKTWKEKYDSEIAKLEAKLDNYQKRLVEFRYKVKKEEAKHKLLVKKLKKADELLVAFFTKRKEVADAKEFEFKGVVFTAETANSQEKVWLLEMKKMRLEEQHSRKRLALYKDAVKKLEQAREELAAQIAKLKSKGQEYALRREIHMLQKELETMKTEFATDKADTSRIQQLLAQVDEQIESEKIREELEQEKQVDTSSKTKSIDEFITIVEEKKKSDVADLKKEYEQRVSK
ncbi:MAG: hypothetical protein D6805_06575 [Planctomycetota bacterium]|nr:MAG: hypothetical protein D6805_06575 [Planctomycetota bacterium]